MMQANLAHRKTETRRTRGLDGINEHPDNWVLCTVGDITHNKKKARYGAIFQHKANPLNVGFIPSPYGQKGDLLWFRERITTETYDGTKYNYYAGNIEVEHNEAYRNLTKWKPSIHMPKDAARVWAIVEDVRIERLHDITEESAIAEGIECIKDGLAETEYRIYTSKNSWDESSI